MTQLEKSRMKEIEPYCDHEFFKQGKDGTHNVEWCARCGCIRLDMDAFEIADQNHIYDLPDYRLKPEYRRSSIY